MARARTRGVAERGEAEKAPRRGGGGAKLSVVSGEDYSGWTRAELYLRAREVGIANRSRMTKSELIEALRHQS